MEAFPVYNKSHMICLEMPNRAGDVSYLLNLVYSIRLILSGVLNVLPAARFSISLFVCCCCLR